MRGVDQAAGEVEGSDAVAAIIGFGILVLLAAALSE
jgi:hypothetical protein